MRILERLLTFHPLFFWFNICEYIIFRKCRTPLCDCQMGDNVSSSYKHNTETVTIAKTPSAYVKNYAWTFKCCIIYITYTSQC